MGRRGSAVSIGLLVERVPCLGVVYAFAYPDDDGDLFAWADGCGPVSRNGVALDPRLPDALSPADVVLLSSSGDGAAAGNLDCVAPARFRTVPSIAHRLALVAAGEAAAAVSLNWPGAWDYGAGHALLRGAGATLIDETGREIAYDEDGRSKCVHAFGGRLEAARALAAREWRRSPDERDQRLPQGFPGAPAAWRGGRGQRPPLAGTGLSARPGRGRQPRRAGRVPGRSRNRLSLRGRSAPAGRRRPVEHPRRPAHRRLRDGARARALDRRAARYDTAAAAHAYRAWLQSRPFDVGNTVRAGAAAAGRTRRARRTAR